MKNKSNYLNRLYLALVCALIPACALADEEISVRGGLSNIKQKLILAPQAGSMDDLNRGLARYDKGDFRGALADINKAILKDPLNSQALFYRGLVRENLGDYVNAVSDFEQNRVAAFDPIVLSEKAYCQTNMYELNAAMLSLNRALAQDHSSSDAAIAFSRRAIVKRLLHNAPDAINDCNQALKLVPDSVETKWQRGITYCSMRKYPDAILDLQFVVQSAPRFADGHYTLAECFRVTGRGSDALSEYKKALALFNEQNNAHGKQSAQTKIAELSKSGIK
ncbi:MAG: tetratricopeptide repeat protein [Cyanobacteria bacterium SZAS-4]|nr:tetratricopeptide repeat protein [Cyanobacteria bacterium SZAS-4]